MRDPLPVPSRLLKKFSETSKLVIPAKAGIQEADGGIVFNSWTPACTGKRSCVSSTSVIHGGCAGVTNFFQQPARSAP
jgi:hypothetical protein